MTRELRQTVLVVVAALLFGYCYGDRNGTADSQNAIIAETAYRLAKTLPAQRSQHIAELLAADSARTAAGRAEEGVSVADQTLGRALDSARIVLADQSATNAELRATIAYLLPKVDTLRMQVGIYRDSVNAAMQASLRERYAAQLLQATTDSTALAFKTLYENERCLIVGKVRCPSRTTTALVSGGSVLILVLLVL